MRAFDTDDRPEAVGFAGVLSERRNIDLIRPEPIKTEERESDTRRYRVSTEERESDTNGDIG